ncbi:MAG: helix-turn-helix transcriptional regulator [SAR324 cluster bacterium]|nr:helix-turn-helix transcriptional regulator [SAR324 cluster bacterium]
MSSTSFVTRFRNIVEQLAGGNRSQFARLTGRSPSHIYRICQGKSVPSMRYLQELSEEYSIDLNWLVKGDAEGDQNRMMKPARDMVLAPVYDVRASAGHGSFSGSEEITEFVGFNKNWLSKTARTSSDQLAMVQVSGDSMVPTLSDGDQILVDLNQTQYAREGIYLLELDDAVMTKRLRNNKNGFDVISDNPDYAPFQVLVDQHQSFRIIGKVVWFGRKLF